MTSDPAVLEAPRINGNTTEILSNGIKSTAPTEDLAVSKDAKETKESEATEKDDEAKEVKEPGSVCETKALIERFDKAGESEIIERGSKPIASTDPYVEYALVTKQSFDEKRKAIGTTLQINSPQLLAALNDVITYYPGEPLEFESKFTIAAPYKLIVHYREELRDYAESSEDEVTKSHVGLLLKHLEAEAGSKGVEIDNLINAKLITFSSLWMIFKPGDILYEQKHGHSRLFQNRKTGYSEHKDFGPYFEISCSFTSYDGINVGTVGERIRIYEKQEFLGRSSSQISSLSVFPLKFQGDTEIEVLQKELLERGKRYLGVKDQCVMQYEGLFLYLKRPPRDFYNECSDYSGSWLPETTSGRVVIDPKTFNEEVRAQKEEVSCGCCDPGEADKDDSKTKSDPLDREDDILGDPQDPLFCPPYVYGFSLEKKEWCKFFIDSMHNVEWKPNALDSLILPAPQKRLLQGLVSAHKFPVRARDEVGLKGKGLVVLLHGTPGSGKTLTAEMTAEHTHRALLNISTGELGSYQYYIEIELKRLLTYASTFQAIVLIDEADVFLEARKSGATSDQSLDQNAMVAVFLRQLEYFQGIIFLTSNRVSVFDAAIKSRIHLALQYESPGKEVRRLLWRKHLGLVTEGKELGEREVGVEQAIEAVQDVGMNGREISNAITTARTLATSEGRALGLEDLRTIVEVWQDFEKSLAT